MTGIASADPSMDGDQTRRDLVRLNMVPGVGAVTLAALLERFGDPSSILRASAHDLQGIPHVGPKLIDGLRSALRTIDVEEELDLCRRCGVRVVTLFDPDYPVLLRQLADRPILLYVKGTLEPTDRLAVSIVGARHATPYGRRAAEKLAGALARVGLTVVSGLARGIDGTAHHAALEAGGRTLAVMANGLNSIYPPEHDRLADRIVQQGALLSESPMRLEPRANLFHRRNRIISGLSLGVVVVEATPKSGSIVTAKHALEQNREVFAVPGPIDSLSSQGCHALIKEGAKLVESVDDILDELRVHLTPLASTDPNANPPTATPDRSLSKNVKITTKTIAAPTQVVSNDEAFLFDLKALQDQDTHPTLNKNETQPDPSSNSHSHNRGASTEPVPPGLILSERERIVWETIGTATLHIDAIIAQSGLDPGSAMATLATLELRRLIGRQPGQMFARLR